MQEGKKSLALSVTIQADDHTLSEEELTSASNKIIESAKQLGAELRS
jgi:phenylalanyl-tRNA synthetase beta subunit